MMIVLLVLSLALHGFTFFLFILVYQQLQGVKEERRQLYGMKEDMEELLSGYTEEMKRENQELKMYFNQQESSREYHFDAQGTAVNKNTRENEKQKEEEPAFFPPFSAEENEFPPPETKGKEQLESSDQAKVLSLASQGLSRDEIAKELNIGKGEVDLFLKFYQ
ncbi:helix-turn-helix transcriptional regulator [Salibacterium aidingense]|uniref:helix-turn-helix transcriptional regulator n=1 Tax=Salibacterium aidingense TaxID=384933 RepID=UPI00041E7B2D|nr:hypothetical protein [Salibacterium aidingense]